MNDTTTATPAKRPTPFIDILVLSCGEYPSPPSLVEAMKHMPMHRRVYEMDGETHFCREPDPKTDQGRRYYEWLRREDARCTAAYIKGEDFTPGDFN